MRMPWQRQPEPTPAPPDNARLNGALMQITEAITDRIALDMAEDVQGYRKLTGVATGYDRKSVV